MRRYMLFRSKAVLKMDKESKKKMPLWLQLIAIPLLLCAVVYLAQKKRNYLPVLLPALFYVFITMSFIFSEKIGFNLPLKYAFVVAGLLVFGVYLLIKKRIKTQSF